MQRIELVILGISSGHSAASYTLILDEVGGARKLPIVIGSAEAQSIAIHIEGITPVRPMTHDLFAAVLKTFHINIVEVCIAKLEEGIFYANITIENKGVSQVIDARTSDAIAMAIRFKAPIFTYPAVLDEAGIFLSELESEQLTKKEEDDIDLDDDLDDLDELDKVRQTVDEVLSGMDVSAEKEDSFGAFSPKELEVKLQEALKEENYVLAAKIRDAINERS